MSSMDAELRRKENLVFARQYGFEFIELCSMKEIMEHPSMQKAIQEACDDSTKVWQSLTAHLEIHAKADTLYGSPNTCMT